MFDGHGRSDPSYLKSSWTNGQVDRPSHFTFTFPVSLRNGRFWERLLSILYVIFRRRFHRSPRKIRLSKPLPNTSFVPEEEFIGCKIPEVQFIAGSAWCPPLLFQKRFTFWWLNVTGLWKKPDLELLWVGQGFQIRLFEKELRHIEVVRVLLLNASSG